MFIIICTNASHLILSWINCIKSTLSNFISVIYVLIRYFYQNYLFRMVLFLQFSPPNPCMHFSSFPYVSYAPPIPSSVIASFYRCVVGCTNREAPHYVFFLAFLYSLPLNGRCFLPVQPVTLHVLQVKMLHVLQVKTQVHWNLKIKLTTKSEGSQRHVVKFIISYVNFVSSKHAVLRCKTLDTLNKTTTNSGAVPRFRQIVAVLSQQRTTFERRQYGIYVGETLGFVQIFPLLCDYHCISTW
jgi:hypothetical protein